MAMAPEQTGIGIRRHFTNEAVDPYDEVVWERRDARITNFRDGTVAFEQRDVEFPVVWSQNATNIVAQKYFRGSLGSPERESSLRQVINRVVDTITAWGRKDGYFVDDEEAEAFRSELKYLILHQKAAFNSPVWFNIGVKGEPQQASACQPYDAPVSTPEGLVPIGRLVDAKAVGTKVFDAGGVTRIVAVKNNGRRVVLRIHTRTGHTLDVTSDHLVWRQHGADGRFVPAGELSPGDQLEWHRTESWGDGQIGRDEIARAALAGWLQADGFVTRDARRGRDVAVEAIVVSDAERAWVDNAIATAFPGADRREERVSPDHPGADSRRIRITGAGVTRFVEEWGLAGRTIDAAVPPQLFTAPLPVVAAYLRSLFQAEGYLSVRRRKAVVGLAMASEQVVRGIQSLLLRFGIFSEVRFIADSRPSRHGYWVLNVSVAADGRRFADEVGFVDPAKASELESAAADAPDAAAPAVKSLTVDRIELLGEMPVYDIQTESGEYLSGNIRVHNCFILSVDDTMRSILNWYVEEGIIFKGGSGAGINLSAIRSSQEQLKGGGAASGPVSFMRGADASAGTIKCLHAETPIVTDDGVVPIREAQVGAQVLTRYGYRPIEAVHDNGVRPLVRVRTELGDEFLCTPEHKLRVRGRVGEQWRRAGELRDDDYLILDLSHHAQGSLQPLDPPERRRTRETRHSLPTHLHEPFALWLGWVFGDGSITTRPGANFVAVQIGDQDGDLVPRYEQLSRSVFGPDVHLYTARHGDRPDASASVRLSSTQIIRFLETNGLRKGRAGDLRIPARVQSSPPSVRAAFLSGLFEADGHIGNGYPALSTVSRAFGLDVHRLLLSIGIPSKVSCIDDRRAALGNRPMYTVRVVGREGVRRFAKQVGFVSDRKQQLLDQAVARKDASRFESQWFLPHVASEFNAMWEESPRDLKRALAPYCRYATPRRLSLLRARRLVDAYFNQLFGAPFAKFADGDELYVRATIEPAEGGHTFDLTVADVHEYLVNNVVVSNSGGKTRRAAKMVILNADHPDVEDFIWCKAVEERKARVLSEAGFDMDLDGKDSHSMQYQNANNSVRLTDEFMQAVLDDADWHLRAVTTGDALKTVKARDLFRQIAQAAWECADPGVQYDTTINRWHTASKTARINASNPCCFVGQTLVDTCEGLVEIERLAKRARAGDDLPLARSFDVDNGKPAHRQIVDAWVAGSTDRLVNVRTESGLTLRCTPEHRFLTRDGYVEARRLPIGAKLLAVSAHGREVLDQVHAIERVSLPEPVRVYDLEVEGTHNFTVTGDSSNAPHAVVVHNSEYMHLDNSACNLASLNLLTFLEEGGRFDVEGFRAAVEVVFTAQEILVGNADYPTEAIGENARRFRQLGLGYANLGAMLMALGLPYDSDAGRAWAAAITSLMTGHAYATSARTAARMGPFAGYSENREPMNRVLRMHRDEVAKIDEELVSVELLSGAQESWDTAVELGDVYGVRNSQASVLAPTGCLVGGSLVATERGLVRLGSLGDPDGDKWQELGIGVRSADGVRTATQFYVNGLEPVVSVETKRGYRIQGTPQHRIKVVDPRTGEWQWRRFGDVGPGELVPLALNQLVGEPQRVPLPPLPDASGTAERHTHVPRQMTAELAELVGYFMGDGSLHSKGLRFCVASSDLDVVDRLERLGKETFGLAAHVTRKQGYTEVAFNSVRLVLWWETCGFAKRSPRDTDVGNGQVRHIPPVVLHSNDRNIYAAFLRGLFEADGTVTVGHPSWATTSLDFSQDVQQLLLALGYPTTRTIDDRTGWGKQPLVVLRLLNAAMGRRWVDEIGFMSARKDGAVHLVESGPAACHDHIPLTRALVDRLAPANDRLRRVLLMELARGAVSRRVAEVLFDRTHDEELGYLLSFFYDRVTSAELGGEELTYDLSVPENVTYVANGFVSHNTIGLMMDCDTTGVEPDLGLCKTKKLVGGGTMTIVNRTVPRALRRLGYSPEQVAEIIAYIDQNKSIVGAPHVSADHLPVFACSMGDNTIHYLGHVKMMGAVQPFLSGAISKTVNVPEDVSVEDVEQLHIDAWRLGVKAIAIYRDNCKVAQPLATTKKDRAAPLTAPAERLVETVVVKEPVREKLPRTRSSKTFSFRVADCHGYVTVGEYEDGRPGEIFLRVAKQGSTLAGIMDAFAISVSHGLQYGVPLRAFVDMYTNMRFEPAGMTDDPDIRFASSLVDYIFRRLAVEYLPFEERAELGILTIDERMQPTLPGVEEQVTPTSTGTEVVPDPAPAPVTRTASPAVDASPTPQASDAPYCYQCGMLMQRAGACFVCSSCGTTSGCS